MSPRRRAHFLRSVFSFFTCFFFFPPSDVAPLSAPAFSFCFPLLNAKLRESSGSTEETENLMTRALQVIMEHCKLRASTDNGDFAIDEVRTSLCLCVAGLKPARLRAGELQSDASSFQNGPELLPRVNMLLLLKGVISTATPRLQVCFHACLELMQLHRQSSA